jgi:ubiquinone/menaquinone biosynthesis C-methylase UbiE
MPVATTETLGELDDHYTNRHNEVDRLGSTLKGQFERQRVREFLARYLPSPPATIADIGGGPGVHAQWLLQEGYDVRLLDPVERHVEQARSAGVSAVLGDARRLPWESGSVEAVLMAGPMYHLIDAMDRRLALREAARVVRPGGIIMAIAINRAANLVGAALANTLLHRQKVVEDILTGGYSPDNERMASTTYHTVTQLRAELSQVSSKVEIHGLTGPGGWLTVLIDAHFRDQRCPTSLQEPDPLQTALECSRMADQLPHLAHTSSLLLGVGRCG